MISSRNVINEMCDGILSFLLVELEEALKVSKCPLIHYNAEQKSMVQKVSLLFLF